MVHLKQSKPYRYFETCLANTGDNDIELEQSINEKLRKVIEKNREALDVLFRSDEKAKQLVVDRVEREIPKGLYWHLDDALYFIEEEIISWGKFSSTKFNVVL